MAFDKKTDWVDYPDISTPVMADDLIRIEEGIDDAHVAIDDHLDRATAENDFFVASGPGTWIKKTLTQITALLELASYAFLGGRSGGQIFTGGTDSGDGLTLISTTDTTKGQINVGNTVYIDEETGRLGVGNASPEKLFEVGESFDGYVPGESFRVYTGYRFENITVEDAVQPGGGRGFTFYSYNLLSKATLVCGNDGVFRIIHSNGGQVVFPSNTSSEFSATAFKPLSSQTWRPGFATDKTSGSEAGIHGENGEVHIITSRTSQVVVDISGNLGVGETSPTAKLHIKNSVATVAGMSARGAISQSANLAEWLDSSGNVLAHISPIGDMEITNFANGVILASPDASRWRITVNNSGTLITTKL